MLFQNLGILKKQLKMTATNAHVESVGLSLSIELRHANAIRLSQVPEKAIAAL